MDHRRALIPSRPEPRTALLLLLCLWPGLSLAQTEAEAPSLESRVDAYLAPYLETANFSGSVLIARKGEILLAKGYGLANREEKMANGPRTAYYLASASRIFTSAAILLLAQEGRLSIQDPLSKHLPEWPCGDEITIHHLLTLSAGLPNINTLRGYGMWSQSIQTPASLCEKFRDLPLEFEPGAKSVHSNSNYNVLALLIEKLSGRSYGDFLQEKLFRPLGMERTAHDDDSKRPVAHRAQGYRPVGHAGLRPDAFLQWSVKTGNGSIYSTVEDLYRFDRMLAAKSLLSETSVAQTFTEHFPSHGYGWFVLNDGDAPRQVTIGGRSPGFGSSWRRAVDADVTVIVLGNLYNGVPTTISRELLAMAMGRKVTPCPLRADPPDPSVLAAVVGAYQFGADFYRANARLTFYQQDGHLFQRGSWIIPAGELTFVHRTYWSTLTFQRDESGKINRLKYDDFIGTRVE